MASAQADTSVDGVSVGTSAAGARGGPPGDDRTPAMAGRGEGRDDVAGAGLVHQAADGATADGRGPEAVGAGRLGATRRGVGDAIGGDGDAGDAGRGDAEAQRDDAEGDGGVPKAAGAALYAFCLVLIIGLPGPLATLVIWRVRRDEPFIDLHGRQALDLFITALLGLVVYITGRILEPSRPTLAGVVQWVGVIVVVIQVLQTLWGIIDAARGGAKSMPLGLRILRRRGAWAMA